MGFYTEKDEEIERLRRLAEDRVLLLAEVERLEGLILDCADDAPGSAGKLQRESRRIRAQREDKPEVWRCEGCGEMFDEPRTSHGRAAHAPGCDGSCQSCPVEVECGPITAQREEGK